ncbi:MAG: potassium transporter TrkG [Verrucomicrobiota bacterium]
MNFPIVFRVLGFLALLIGIAMGTCWGYAMLLLLLEGESPAGISAARALGMSASISLGLGAFLVLTTWRAKTEVLRREAVAIVGLSWIEVGLLGVFPYLLSDPGLGYIDSLFESVSGFTTTGSTVMTNIEVFPRAILIWRSLSQWLGGIGILVVFVAVLSLLKVGSRSLVQNESSLNISDSGATRIRDVALSLLVIYVSLTTVCGIGNWLLGMSSFDAIAHAMTTIATGGFSTRNASIGAFDSVPIEIWIGIFMFLSSIGFMLYVFVIKRNWSRLRAEEEAKFYALLIAAAIIAIAADLMFATEEFTFLEALEDAFFNVISIGSTTGFGVGDYDGWPLFSKMLLIVMMLVGGCAGSTAGGIKMNRVILFFKTTKRELIHSFRPSQVFQIKLNGTQPDERVFATTSFFIALGFTFFGGGALIVSLLEPKLDLISAVSVVGATLFNIGPGFQAVGPTQNFAFLGSDTKVLCCFLMILGRLEFFALLVLVLPTLWRRY